MDFISSVVTRGGNSSLGSGFDLIVNKDSKYLVIRFSMVKSNVFYEQS